MQDTFPHLLFARIDTTRNMARFYALSLEPSLFDDCAVVRRWGRLGTKGRFKIELFRTSNEALRHIERLARSKQKRGYVELPRDKS